VQSKAGPRMMVNAASLAAATIITSALGIVFWSLAARLFSPAEVGLANAQLSGATLIAAFASLNLASMLLLYLPRAGKRSRWLLTRTYTVTISLSLLVVFVIVLIGTADKYLPDALSVGFFVCAVPLMAIFAQQDSALLAMGAGPVVAVENAAFAVGKILLLPVFAMLGVASGIFAAWVIPVGLAVFGVTGYIWRKLITDHSELPDTIEIPARRLLWPQLAKLYSSFVAGQLTNLAIPLVVVGVLGTTQGGYFTMAWLVGVSFSALITNVTQAFAQDVRRGHEITRATLKRLATLLGLIAIVGGTVTVIAAPLILKIMAPGYAPFSTTLLRCIGLAVPLQATWIVMAMFLWLENRVGWMALGNVTMATIAISTTYFLAPHVGITAAGLGLIAGEGTLTLISIYPLFARVRHIRAGFGADWAGRDHEPPRFNTRERLTNTD